MNFTMSVENVGNTWVSAIAVVDPFLEGIACSPDLSASDSRFAVGAAAVVCTATVSVDQAMVDDGFMESESTVSQQQCEYCSVVAQRVSPAPNQPLRIRVSLLCWTLPVAVDFVLSRQSTARK